MKTIYKYILLFLLSGFFTGLTAQNEDDIYTTVYNRIEPVLIELSKYPHGTVQWQESKDEGSSWMDIPGANQYSHSYITDTSVYVRAMVKSGSCDPIYSQYTSLRSIKVWTGSVDSISASSALIHCEIDTGDVALMEYGLLYSAQPTVDENTTRIELTFPLEENFNVSVEGLEEGIEYYARAYAVTKSDTYIYGNTVSFSTMKVSLLHNQNISKDSAWFKYMVSGVELEDIDEHGIFINTVTGSLPTSEKYPGYEENDQLTAVAGSLSAGSDYFVQAYIRLGESYFYSAEKKITTWSDYNDPVDSTIVEVHHTIQWNDQATAIRLNPSDTYGDYGRVERLGNTDTLLLVYQGGPNTGDWINIYLRKSYNNGETWSEQEILMDLADYPGQYWRFCTPEVLFLQNGWILVAFEANARPDENQSSVQILISKDSTTTWEEPIIYKTGRTWEPAMVQLQHGEIELFYSSEAKWWPGSPLYQDIQVIRSTDNGVSWSDPQVVAYYPQKRDGMPVPLLLNGNKGVVFAIETVSSGNSPYVIHRPMDEPCTLTTSNYFNSPYRRWVTGFGGHGGAPYILQLPTGETVLSVHIYRGGDWRQNNYQEVMMGNNNAKNFSGISTPWGIPPMGEGAINNSLFLKDDTTIVTISTRNFSNGTGGLYWLEGKIVPE